MVIDADFLHSHDLTLIYSPAMSESIYFHAFSLFSVQSIFMTDRQFDSKFYVAIIQLSVHIKYIDFEINSLNLQIILIAFYF